MKKELFQFAKRALEWTHSNADMKGTSELTKRACVGVRLSQAFPITIDTKTVIIKIIKVIKIGTSHFFV